jgi:hypothetical protein
MKEEPLNGEHERFHQSSAEATSRGQKDAPLKFQLAIGHKLLSDEEILSRLETERYQYLPKGFDERGILCYQFQRTCEALGIPKEQWPDFDMPAIPCPERMDIRLPKLVFSPPPLDLLRDSITEWRKKAESAWAEHIDKCVADAKLTIQKIAKAASLAPQKRRREKGRASPMRLRLEWAARHYCCHWSYAEIHMRCNGGFAKPYSLDVITKAVQALLDELGLRGSATCRPDG